MSGGDDEEGHVEEVFGWEKYGFTRNHERITAEYLLFFLTLLSLALILQFYVGKVWHLHYLPESGATIILGMVIGGIARLVEGNEVNHHRESFLSFSPLLFFIGFLPPIIYNGGYQLNCHLFFNNLGGIMALAIVGTTISTAVVGCGLYGLGLLNLSKEMTLLETICFGSLISATDPVSTLAVFSELKVDPTLFYLVFGESVLNDAIGITLFRTTAKFVGSEFGGEDALIAIVDFIVMWIGSLVIGYVLGLVSAWIFKVVDMSHYRLLLVALFVCLIYMPFLLSETLQLSGIVTILVSSVTVRRYSNKNIPLAAQRAASFVFELLAYLSESAVFLFLGMDVFALNSSTAYDAKVIFWSLLLCIVGRTHVYPLLTLVNNYRTKRAKETGRDIEHISTGTMHMIMFSGLRGLVAYALSNVFPDDFGNRDLIINTTMVIVLITIFVKGGLTGAALKYLNIEVNVNPRQYIKKLKKIYLTKRNRFLHFEEKYVYPIVLKEKPTVKLEKMSKHGIAELQDDTTLGSSIHRIAVVEEDEDEEEEEYILSGRFPTNKPKSPDSPRTARIRITLDENGDNNTEADSGFIELKRQPNVNLMDLSKSYYDV